MADLADGTPADIGARVQEQWKQERVQRPKADLIAMLEESFASVRKKIGPLRASQLGRETQFFGDTTTVRGVYIALASHASEHLGQLIAYARIQGVKPPWNSE